MTMSLTGFRYDRKRKRAVFDGYVAGTRGKVRRERRLDNVSHDQALAAWKVFRADLASGRAIDGPLTLREFVAKYYELIAASHAPGTRKTQGVIIKNHLLRYFGDSELTTITSMQKTQREAEIPISRACRDALRVCQTKAVASVYVFVDMHGTAAGTPAGGKPVSASDPSHYIGVTVGNQGCTPGYWKNHTDSWPATGYSPTQTVSSVFAQASLYPSGISTLLAALDLAGGPGVDGAAEILLRAATAALLNASHAGVSYPRPPSTVIADVNGVLASQNRDVMLALAAALDADNNLGCPLN